MTTLFRTVPKLAKIFSGGSLLRGIFLLLLFWMFTVEKKIVNSKRAYTFTLHYRGKRFTLYLQHLSDISVLQEVFIDEEYRWQAIEDPKIIIDLGAHFGDTALYYHCQFPEAKIIAVEPSPESFSRLQKHVAGIKNIIPLQVAIGSTNDYIQLHLQKSSLGNSVVERAGTTTSVEVKQITLQTLYDEYSIGQADIVKFDIEGGEFDLLTSVHRPEDFSRAYIGELHFDLVAGYTLDWVKGKFAKFSVMIEPIRKRNRFIIKANK